MNKTHPEPILRTKLYKPGVKDHYVIRKSIINQLEKNRHNPLTLVVAATGYGKSVTISEWLDHTKAQYCWLSLDDEFNDVRTFFLYLIYAIRSVFPDALSQLQDLLQGSEMPSQKVLVRLLINSLDETDQELIIVLDDYQTINNNAIHEIIGDLIKNPLPKLHLVIISRRDPKLNLNSLHTFGEINELRMVDLSFTLDEIKALAEKNLNIQMTDKQTSLLKQKTEGWIVGLRMALMHIAKSKDIEKSIKDLKLDQQYFRQYLLDEILRQQPEPVRKLLITASILDRFSRELLEAVLGKENETRLYPDKALFDQLISSILFIIPLDEEGQWYRFHHLFHDLVQNQLAHLYDDQEIKTLYAKTSDWFESHNLIDEAIRYAVKSEDYFKAVHIIEQNRLLQLMLEQWWVVNKWIQLIPENIVQEHTILLLTKSFIYQEEYRYEELIYNIQKLEQRLSDQPDNRHLGELLIHKGYLNVWVLGNPKEAVEQLERSKSLFPDRGELGMRRQHQLAIALQMTGHKKRALQALRKEISNPENSEHFKTSMVSGTTTVHLLSGELKQAISSAHKYISLLKERGFSFKFFWAEFLLTSALYQCYELKKAKGIFEKLLTSKDVLYPGIAAHVFVGYCLTTAMLGDFETSEKALKELDSYARDSGSEKLIEMAQSCRARIHLLQGKNELALEWSKFYLNEPHTSELHLQIEVPAITKARIWIASGSNQMVQDAVTDLNELLIKIQNVHNNYQMVDIQVLLAIGYFQLGDNNSAEKSIAGALIISEENGFMRPFIEPGRLMVKLFKNLSLYKSHEKFVKILRRYWPPAYDEEKTQKVSTQNADPALGNTLSRREKELLQLVADGFRNKEIADKLYLSTESIKKYLYYIYQKLGVNNRTSAVNKATQVGLLKSSDKID